MPLSSELADAVVARLDAADKGRFDTPEMASLQPLLALQAQWSHLPAMGSLLIEHWHSREGSHAFVYPFAGRQVHLGLATLLAWRLASVQPATFSIAVNDYGFELLTSAKIDWPEALTADMFGEERLLEDVLASLNAGELARRRFREIARVSGLIFQGHPGERKSGRQLQASAGLFYEVFRQHDPANLLLSQAQTEVLRQELEIGRLALTLRRIQGYRFQYADLQRPSPFAFPLLVERFREMLSTEKLSDRIARMLASLEKAAGHDSHTDGTPGVQGNIAFALGDTPAKGTRPRRARKPSRPLPLL